MPSDTPASIMPRPVVAADPSDGEAHEPQVKVNLTFWQHPAVQNLLPFATSLAFHVGLIFLVALAWATHAIINSPAFREQLIIPDATIVEGAAVGGVPNPGLGSDPNLSASAKCRSGHLGGRRMGQQAKRNFERSPDGRRDRRGRLSHWAGRA